jgi:hypothetical protein
VTMDLATHQRLMAGLVLGDVEPDGAPPELGLFRAIGADWQALGLRAHCPLTWRTLVVRQRRTAVVRAFSHQPGVSQHLHVQSRQFLEAAAADTDAVVVSVARFERSLLDAAVLPAPDHGDGDGDRPDVVIDWPCDPLPVLQALAAGDGTLPVAGGPHRSAAPARRPTLLRVSRLPASAGQRSL